MDTFLIVPRWSPIALGLQDLYVEDADSRRVRSRKREYVPSDNRILGEVRAPVEFCLPVPDPTPNQEKP